MKYPTRDLVLMASAMAVSIGAAVEASAAGACTYREALMAMERNNTVRGMALMRMASADGDVRATAFLAARRQEPTDGAPRWSATDAGSTVVMLSGSKFGAR